MELSNERIITGSSKEEILKGAIAARNLIDAILSLNNKSDLDAFQLKINNIKKCSY